MPARARPATLTLGDIRLLPLTWANGAKLAEVHERNREWLGMWEATGEGEQVRGSRGAMTRSYWAYVARHRREAAAGTALPWVIEIGRAVVGHVVIGQIAGVPSWSGTVGYWVDRDHAGQGIAPAAVALAVDFAFGHGGLHRVEAAIHPDNTRSLAVVGKLGFRDEGTRHRYLHVRGVWADHRIFALTREEASGGLVERWNQVRRPKARGAPS
ncbi:MAG: GNAT family N-acetyltransferase [Bifidobacteriaceae bacterium]|jgi:ribosomal-protein-alanine N-acetyltransferase|nr:GNAT family N-acetyltransferase [Bifidobacteriaceae bacterium]